MQRYTHKRSKHRKPAMVAAAALLGLAPHALGGVHTWLGGVGDADWSTAANWNTFQVPAAGDAVIILDGPSLGVVLSEDTALLKSVYIGGGMWLSNVGHRIRVSGNIASTTVTQANSILQLTPEGANGLGKSLDTDTLKVQSGAELQMAGGRAEVDDELRVIGSGSITGHGRIDVRGAQNAAFGAVDGTIDVDGGTLRINMINDGSMSLPPEIDIAGEGNRLRLDGPFHAPLNDVDLVSGGRLSVREDWTLNGTLRAMQLGTATVDGDGRGTFPGTVSVSNLATLVFDGEVEFESSGQISLGGIAGTMQLNDLWFVDPGHQTSIGYTGRLVFGESSSSYFGWNGDIAMDGGKLELDTQTTFSGELVASSGSFGTAPRIQGDATAWFTGEVVVDATPAVFQADFEARPGSSFNVMPGATMEIAGVGTIRAGANAFGGGAYRVAETGTLTADGGEMVAADVLNDGRLAPGQPTGLLTIFGEFAQGSTGTLAIQIAGAGVGQTDRVDVSGTADISGTLEVELFGGYEPGSGSSFVVLTADAVNGAFDQVTGPAGMQVAYYADQVIVTFDACPEDLDGSGQVGFDDLVELLGLWGECFECEADLNGSGGVDFDDLVALLGNWGPC